MDVYQIDPTTWSSNDIIEKYDSMIWTERFQTMGEFELKTQEIEYTMALMPVGSFIGLRDSTEVMIVEDHSVAITKEGSVLTVKGRTLEAFFENRMTVIVNQTPGASAMLYYSANDIWPTDAAKALIMSHVTVCDDAPLHRIPNTSVENLVTNHTGEETLSYKHEVKALDEEILSLIQMEDAGIRTQLNFSGEAIFYIYKGLDRTMGQSVRPQVVFSYGAEHIVDPNYVWTKKDYRNVAYVVGTNWQQRVYAPGVSTSVAGFDRRILYVDGNEIEATSSVANKTKQAKALGLAALAEHNKTMFFDAEISLNSPYTRGIDYNLGDLVTLQAQYGVSQTMLINEFVRTQDNTGDRSFPTLIVPN